MKNIRSQERATSGAVIGWPKKLILILFLFLQASGWSTPVKDPTYSGKRVSEWVALLGDRDEATVALAGKAVLSVGADAVPYLVHALGQPDALLRGNVTVIIGKLLFSRKIGENDPRREQAISALARAFKKEPAGALKKLIGGPLVVLASAKGNIKEIKALIAAGADPEAKDSTGQTALITASSAGQTEVVKALIAAGADVNAKDDAWTTLMYASSKRHTEVVKALIAAGADVNAKDDDWTALTLASHNGQTEVVKALIVAGADVNAKDDDGWTALMHASEEGHTEVVKLLKETGAQK